MGSVPAEHRGAASGMRATFQNSGTALSIGVFFSLMTSGLATSLPRALTGGLQAQGVPADTAAGVAHLPPVSTLFAAFLGNNPIRQLLEPTGVLARLPAHDVATLTGRTFFPRVIAAPFHHGLTVVFTTAAIMAAVAAVASVLRGRQHQHADAELADAALI
jgi:hypothetical protein